MLFNWQVQYIKKQNTMYNIEELNQEELSKTIKRYNYINILY